MLVKANMPLEEKMRRLNNLVAAGVIIQKKDIIGEMGKDHILLDDLSPEKRDKILDILIESPLAETSFNS